MRVYHFLTEQFGLQAIVYRRLKVSRIQDVNDPFEWSAPLAREKQYRLAFEKMKAEMSSDRGIICFSKDWSNPLLWSHYGDRHRGWCLGFDLPDEKLVEVKYLTDRIACDWSKFHHDEKYQLSVIEAIMVSKFRHWEYESEMRALISLDHETRINGLYFVDFSANFRLAEVIVGANCVTTREQLKNALGPLQDQVQCKKARLAFKSFAVVEQKNAKIWP